MRHARWRLAGSGLPRAAALRLAPPLALPIAFALAAWPVAARQDAPATAARTTVNRALLLNPDAPDFQRAAPEHCRVTLDTSRGAIVIDVTRAWSPRGADRFVNLVRAGYYDDTIFFRVVKDRWAQFGINGDPAIAKVWRSRTFPDDPFVQSNVHGTVAFAFAVPSGRTTQVFINLRDNSAVNDKEPFTPFGRIVEGLDVADSLNSEYGEAAVGGIRAGRQDRFFDAGNAFLLAQFPRLDIIKRALIR